MLVKAEDAKETYKVEIRTGNIWKHDGGHHHRIRNTHYVGEAKCEFQWVAWTPFSGREYTEKAQATNMFLNVLLQEYLEIFRARIFPCRLGAQTMFAPKSPPLFRSPTRVPYTRKPHIEVPCIMYIICCYVLLFVGLREPREKPGNRHWLAIHTFIYVLYLGAGKTKRTTTITTKQNMANWNSGATPPHTTAACIQWVMGSCLCKFLSGARFLDWATWCTGHWVSQVTEEPLERKRKKETPPPLHACRLSTCPTAWLPRVRCLYMYINIIYKYIYIYMNEE